MDEFIPVGEVRAYAGNPVTAAGADMNDLGKLGNFTYRFVPKITKVGINGILQSGGQQLQAVILQGRLELYDQDNDILSQFFPWSALTGTSLGAGTAGLVPARSLCILPLDEVANGVDSDYGFWFPDYHITNDPEGLYNAKADQENVDSNMVVEFEALWRTADSGATAIPFAAAGGFRGQPDDFGLTWFLP